MHHSGTFLDTLDQIATIRTRPIAIDLKQPMVWAGGADRLATPVIVELETKDGVLGYGESPAALSPAVVDSTLREMARDLVGRSLPDASAILADIGNRSRWRFFQRLANYARVGLETAILDAWGQTVGLPINAFFGGPLHSSIDHYFWIHRGASTDWDQEVSLIVSQAEQAAQSEHRVVYLKLGVGEPRDIAVALVQAIRHKIGPSKLLRIDANQAWDLATAQWILSRVADAGIDFVEEPLERTMAEDLRTLRTKLPMRLSVDQGAWLPETMLGLAEAGAIDVVCTDSSRVGGGGQLVSTARALSTKGVQVCRHTGNEVSIFLAASIHALSAIPNLEVGNQYCDLITSDVIDYRLVDSSGRALVPDSPGLGIDVNRRLLDAAADRFEELSALDQEGGRT